MFYHAYRAYMDNAFPADELQPLSCKGRIRGVSPSRGDMDDVMGKWVAKFTTKVFFLFLSTNAIPSRLIISRAIKLNFLFLFRPNEARKSSSDVALLNHNSTLERCWNDIRVTRVAKISEKFRSFLFARCTPSHASAVYIFILRFADKNSDGTKEFTWRVLSTCRSISWPT